MKNKKIKRALVTLMTLVMVFTMLPTSAFAVTQSEINQLKKERDSITANRREKQEVVDSLESEHASIMERKLAMDERNMYTIEQMELNAEEIALYDEMIATKAEELEAALKLENEQLERYRARVRAMEENGSYGFLALVLNATSLGELLTVVDDIGEIMESDRQLEEEYIAARENTEAVKKEYEEYKAEIEEKQAALREEQVQLEKDIEEAINVMRELESDIENRQEEIDAIAAAEDEANAEIDRLVAELQRQREEEERRKREEAAAGSSGNSGGSGGSGGGGGTPINPTGSFIWPTTSTVITSPYGPRIHPVTGQVGKMHSGVDIGAGAGEPVYAADSGSVVLAGVNGGYGNCVMIDHGNGYITLYGHMSSIAVSNGQSVSQGDIVGYVGSTGISTGPHLHFEVRQNGGTVNPMSFF